MGFQGIIQCVERRQGIADRRLRLMRTGHGLQLFAVVKHSVGEVGHVGMHSALLAQNADEGFSALRSLPFDEAFEQRLPAVIDANGLQQRVVDFRYCRIF